MKNTGMNTKTEKIAKIRKYFIENKMFSELRGFNAGVRMFDDNPKHKGMKPVRTQRRLEDGTIETSTKWVPDVPELKKTEAPQQKSEGRAGLPWAAPTYQEIEEAAGGRGRRDPHYGSSGTPSTGGSMGW